MQDTPGQVMRRLRRQQRLSLQQVAAKLGVHFTTLSSWERDRSQPPLQTLERLARLLGVSPGELLGRRRYPEPLDPFRPLSSAAAERMVRVLEETRLAIALHRELQRPDAAAELAERTGISALRLATLASGDGRLRPPESAALVRELGGAGELDPLDPLDRLDRLDDAPPPPAKDAPQTPPARLPAPVQARLETVVSRIRRYLEGSHQ